MMSFDKTKTTTLKALMAILIIFDHLTFYTNASWLQPFREIGPSIVSVFLFISGYGLSVSFQRKGEDYLKGFFNNRLLKVLIPAFGALLLFYLLAGSPTVSIGEDARRIIKFGIFPLPQLWFVVAITFFYILFYVCFRFINGKAAYWGLACGSLIYILAAIFLGLDRCWWICGLSFLSGSIFSTIEKPLYDLFEKRPATFWALAAISLIITAICYLTSNQYIWILCYVFIPFVVALFVAKLPFERINTKIVAFLGTIFYEVYLCHGIAMATLRGKHLWLSSDWLFILLVFAMTLLLAYILNKVSSFTHNSVTRKAV